MRKPTGRDRDAWRREMLVMVMGASHLVKKCSGRGCSSFGVVMGPLIADVVTPRLAAAEIGNDVGLLLGKLHAAGSTLNKRILSDFRLRERSFSVLTLACSGLEATQREIAEFLDLDLNQVAGLVDDLEHRGLVERVPGQRNRRSRAIVSTQEGRRIHNKIRAELDVCEQRQLARLCDDEVTQLKQLLRKALWG